MATMDRTSPTAEDDDRLTATERFRAARDTLLRLRLDLDAAHEQFEWPRFEQFNFALDWFDVIAQGERADQEALVIVEGDGTRHRRTYRELSRCSSRAAQWLRGLGVRRGDRVLLMLGNQAELWELMLACLKLGAVMIPTTVMLGPAGLADRVRRGQVSWVVAGPADAPKFREVPGDYEMVLVEPQQGAAPAADGNGAEGEPPARCHRYAEARSVTEAFEVLEPSPAQDATMLYFTSGTTSKAKLVTHTNTTYPVGHLSTMYWIGLEPGDVHLNVASPGWGKHAWSNFFAPFIAEATVFVHNRGRFDPAALMEQMGRESVTSFCAPPTVWRMLIQADLSRLSRPPRKLVSAGEPLNPGVIDHVARAWGTPIRDGFGQTESTLQIANTPGETVVPGAMGRALPGYEVELRDPRTREPVAPDADGIAEGELCLRLDPWPVGLTPGYADDPERTAEVFADGIYRTGDVARRDARGVFTYVGRSDDVFKSSDYRISPFELESAIILHPAVAEVGVVPSPDPLRLAVPKAYVVLAAGHEPTAGTAREILGFCREHLEPFQRIRRLEFHELPKTISGKIRRVELRARELEIHDDDGRAVGGQEYRDDQFPGLQG